MSLINDHNIRAASVYADSLVNCYALERRDFERTLDDYPDQRKQIERLANTRMRNNEYLTVQLKMLEMGHGQFAQSGGFDESYENERNYSIDAI